MHVGLVCAILTVGLAPPSEPDLLPPKLGGDTYPAPGSDIPGPFPTYNVTGKNATRFHGLISHHGLNPVAMVLVNGVDNNVAVAPLLQQLNLRVVHNPDSRVGAFAVFYADDKLKNPITDDDELEAMEAEVKKLDQGVSDVVLALAPRASLEEYLKKDKDAAVTVVLYDRLRVVSVHTFKSKDAINGDAILREIATKFGADRESDD